MTILTLITITTALILYKLLIKRSNRLELSDNDAILISGCDSGIGLELAKHFIKEYKCKIICGFLQGFMHNNTSKGYIELLNLKQESRGRIVLAQLDLTSDDDIAKLIEEITALGCNLFALINNAGIMNYGEFDWLTWEHIQSQIDVNLTGTIRLTRAVLPFIIRSKGRIVNVSSVNDATVFPGLSVYSATKSAISIWSRGIGYELRKFDVSVISIRLGDFARLTNIMSKHVSNQTAMWEEMSAEKKLIYKDFFPQFNGHLLKNYGMTSPKNFGASSLFGDFETALLSRNPPTTITCAPLRFRIFYFFVELLPVWVQYVLLDQLIRFGFNWKPPAVMGIS